MANALGSRPKNEYEKKLVGIVSVISGNAKAKLTLLEEGKTFKNGTNELKVNLSDLPKHPHIEPNDKSGRQYRVRMNNDGDAVEALTPVRGHFMAKLVDIGPHPEKDADPIPQERVWNEGTSKENRYFEFWASYKIVSGDYKDAILPAYHLHYKFEEDPEKPGFTRFAGNFDNKKATRLFQVYEWGNVHGLWETPIPWNEVTILPILLKRALTADRVVEVNLDKGYILKEGGVMSSDGYNEDNFGASDDDLDDVDEEFSKRNEPKKISSDEEDDEDL